MPVPPSDPHTVVPSDYVFPTTPQRIGRGINSGRNLLVIIDGQQEPVLRVPLLISRLKRVPTRDPPYPDEHTIIPAGTTLRDVLQYYPRHVWGEMLRVFLSERWEARAMYDLLPQEARNHANTRPWNYLQAAMGREMDQMSKEETGKARIKVKKDNSAKEEANNEKPLESKPQQYYPEEQLTRDTLIYIASANRGRAVRAERARLVLEGTPSRREADRRWHYRHGVWLRQMLVDWRTEQGHDMPTRQPVEVMRIIWLTRYPQQVGESLLDYQTRATDGAWRFYAQETEQLADDADRDLEEALRAQDEQGDITRGEGRAWKEEADKSSC